jgi:predicted O-methyltransferase YrrM
MLEYGEQEILFDIPRILKLGGNYLNLGHAEGGSAMLMARGMAWENLTGLVHSVDTFDDYRNHFEKAVRILERRHCTDSVKLYSGKTFEFVDTFREMPLSFVFIDADHSYEGVRNDFLNFSPMVVLGGAVAFHDTNQEPSHKVIEENLTGNPAWEKIYHVNRIEVFKRVL